MLYLLLLAAVRIHSRMFDQVHSSSQSVSTVSRDLRPAQEIIRHFGDESFQAIICTGTDNSKQTGENTKRTQNKRRKEKHTKHQTKPKRAVLSTPVRTAHMCVCL